MNWTKTLNCYWFTTTEVCKYCKNPITHVRRIFIFYYLIDKKIFTARSSLYYSKTHSIIMPPKMPPTSFKNAIQLKIVGWSHFVMLQKSGSSEAFGHACQTILLLNFCPWYVSFLSLKIMKQKIALEKGFFSSYYHHLASCKCPTLSSKTSSYVWTIGFGVNNHFQHGFQRFFRARGKRTKKGMVFVDL